MRTTLRRLRRSLEEALEQQNEFLLPVQGNREMTSMHNSEQYGYGWASEDEYASDECEEYSEAVLYGDAEIQARLAMRTATSRTSSASSIANASTVRILGKSGWAGVKKERMSVPEGMEFLRALGIEEAAHALQKVGANSLEDLSFVEAEDLVGLSPELRAKVMEVVRKA